MITQVVYLKDYDWLLKVFYEVDREDSDVILNELDQIDCDPKAFYALADQLENGNLNLDESVSKFEEGMKIAKQCNNILEDAEKKITILLEKDGELKEEKFEVE